VKRYGVPVSSPSKNLLKAQLVEALSADLGMRERAYRAARDAATDDEAKPENDKDTRALEQSYLARGESRRIEELRNALAEVLAMPLRDLADDEPAALGTLVTVRDQNEANGRGASLFWLAPHGGGSRLGGTVQVLTPKSPMGRALLGKHVGDECEVVVAGATRAFAIVAMR
jgi:transcription elongation GreA/GreB family factor